MRLGGLQQAIDAAGGVSSLARALGLSQPTVSAWRRVPSERVLAVEEATGVARGVLRPDLYPEVSDGGVDELEAARAAEYRLLSALFAGAPKAAILEQAAQLRGDATPLGMAHAHLSAACARADADAVDREYFDLFVGVGRGELLPYGSYYLSGFTHDRPLARLRADLAALGIERAAPGEPEDHIAFVFEAMAGLIDATFDASAAQQRDFYERHVESWAPRFLADLAVTPAAVFYRPVAEVGAAFLDIETRAFALAAASDGARPSTAARERAANPSTDARDRAAHVET